MPPKVSDIFTRSRPLSTSATHRYGLQRKRADTTLAPPSEAPQSTSTRGRTRNATQAANVAATVKDSTSVISKSTS